MLELNGNTLVFSFPEVHPEARLTISFERTCRIPDDGKNYPLPGSLGHFPLKHVDDYRKRVPHEWEARGGIMLPMYQSEAMWLRFKPQIVRDRRHNGQLQYPFAVKVAAGKMSAVTGKEWSNKLRKGDYMVTPPQQWLDGFVVDKGLIKQFVAMPLGMGATVEEQLTGEAEWGGLQIEVLPMKREAFERRFPKLPPPPVRPIMEGWSGRRGGVLRSRSRKGGPGGGIGAATSFTTNEVKTNGGVNYSAQSVNTLSGAEARAKRPEMYTRGISDTECSASIDGAAFYNDISEAAPAADMGLGAGGSMVQDIKKDPYDKADWLKKAAGRRCYIHLANSLAWQAITGEQPPTVPPTAKDYKRMGLPWFDLYEDNVAAIKASAALKGVKSVLEFGYQHGLPTLPENKSVKIKRVNMLQPAKVKGKKKHPKAGVREGQWAE